MSNPTPRIPSGKTGIASLGHRTYVGGLWGEVGRLQFNFLAAQGLKPNHVLCDVACGCLRGGVHFIPYLEKGNYLGIDLEEELINRGIEKELGRSVYEERKPEFVISGAFEFDRFSKKPTHAIAQSLFTHLTEADIKVCLGNLSQFAGPGCTLYATFFESDRTEGKAGASHSHVNFFYTRDQMSNFGRSTGWMADYIGDWGHPRSQMMMRYTAY